MTPKSFSVRIFLQDGHAGGVKIIAKSKWSGRGLVIPRSSFPEENNRDELNAPGVYVLVGPANKDDLPTIYIGAADPVCAALQEHDCQTDFWSWTFVFASKDGSLTHTHFQYLEARLMHLARDAKRANLDNWNNPELPKLSADELTSVESFLEHILSVCPVLGLSVFEKSVTSDAMN